MTGRCSNAVKVMILIVCPYEVNVFSFSPLLQNSVPMQSSIRVQQRVDKLLYGLAWCGREL